ncbi:MAG: hypothetical protein GEV09_15085 [Pseudonocardiaceae bacterium]|nr:hypothetical protein [Pseudonocardiaceae bacterium]
MPRPSDGGALYLADFGGRVTASDGLTARLQRRSQRLRDNLGDGVPARLRAAGFGDVTELTHRASRVGRVTYYSGTAPARR